MDWKAKKVIQQLGGKGYIEQEVFHWDGWDCLKI